MTRLVLLLEEPSMKAFLDNLLPRHFPGLAFLCIPHEGKHDLEKSIPRKLRAWNEPGARFLVLRDNDRQDCLGVKARLQALCLQAGRPEAVVRIACQELEAWYLGSPSALAEAFAMPALANLAKKSKFRDPDRVAKPSAELSRLIPEFQKVSAARRMGDCLPGSAEESRSRSYAVFLEALRRLASEMAFAPAEGTDISNGSSTPE